MPHAISARTVSQSAPVLARARRSSVAAALGLVLGLWACGEDPDSAPDDEPGPSLGPCTAEARAGLLVTVEGAAACDDLRFDVAGNDRLGAEFGCFGEGTCDCYGLWEQPGTFSVTVSDASSGATLAELPEVVIGRDSCHVVLETLTVQL